MLTLLFASIAPTGVYAADSHRELLLFPFAHSEYNTAHETHTDHADNEILSLAADAFFALRFDQFRFLTEFLISTEEIDLERVQLGYEFSPKHFFWLGRFHSPLDYWNSQYSHAAFLQGSIHRPSIVEYEDHGGFLPAHGAGAMFEGDKRIGNSALEYNILFGIGTRITDEGLMPVSLIGPLNTKETFNIFSRIAYRPDDTSMYQYGAFAVYTDFETEITQYDDAKQLVSGVYAYNNLFDFRITTAVFFVDNSLTKNQITTNSSLLAGYVHADYELTSKWLGYIRYEDSIGAENDPFISLLTEYPARRGVLGTRYDINSHHALSLETALLPQHDELSAVVTIQWSAVYP